MVTAVGIPQDNRCLRRWALGVGPARGLWTKLGRLPLRVFSIGKYAFQKKQAMGVGCRHPARQQVLAAMSRECPYFRKISRVVRVYEVRSPVDHRVLDNDLKLMSAKLRELMLKHVYYVHFVPKDRRIGPVIKRTCLVKTTKLKVLFESDVYFSCSCWRGHGMVCIC